jgi:hypothetical protein
MLLAASAVAAVSAAFPANAHGRYTHATAGTTRRLLAKECYFCTYHVYNVHPSSISLHLARSTCMMTSSSFRHQTLCTRPAALNTHAHIVSCTAHSKLNTPCECHAHTQELASKHPNQLGRLPTPAPSFIQNSVQLPPQHRPAIHVTPEHNLQLGCP